MAMLHMRASDCGVMYAIPGFDGGCHKSFDINALVHFSSLACFMLHLKQRAQWRVLF
jgi:hypothetical protein